MFEERRFTAIIPHRNRPAVLAHSLRQLEQTWGRWLREIIVVDDGSAADKVPEPALLGPRVRLVRSGHRGPAACRNEAATIAGGDLLLYLDDDSWPAGGALNDVIAAFDSRPQLAAVGFRVMLGQRCESGGAFNAFVGCAAAVRRAPFLAVGGFPEEFFFYAEEYALCYRLLRAGYQVRMWSEPAAFHHKDPRERDQAAILAHLVRNNRRLYEPWADELAIVARRLETILNWYRLLGQRYGVSEAVDSALREPIDAAAEPFTDGATWRYLLGLDLLQGLVGDVTVAGIQAVSLWPIGKDVELFAAALGDAGVEVLELLDPERRYRVAHYAGLPVAAAPMTESGAIVVASFSPGLCWNAAAGRAIGAGRNVYCGFGFVDAAAPPDLAVSRCCIPFRQD